MSENIKSAKKDVILVVDDQPNNLKVIGSVLGGIYTISIANNGENALKLLDNFHPDLILLDVMMPDMDGYEVCRRIKQNHKTKDIPVIFLTAKSDVNDIVKGFESGGVDYITKPFNPLEVKIRVKNHLKLYHSEKAMTNRDQILNSLVNASEIFLKTSHWEMNIDTILKQFTKILKIDRTLFHKNDDSEGFKVFSKTRFTSICNISDKDNIYSGEIVVCDISNQDNWFNELKKNNPVWGVVSSNEADKSTDARSILLIPVFVDVKFWGIIEFGDMNKERIWQKSEIETLMLIGNIIGAAIKRTNVENRLKKVYEGLMHELDLASSVQQLLLPNWVDKDDKIIFSSTYKPYNKIGGDFYDYQKISDSEYVSYVGDVSGHGVQASLIMTAVKSIINMLISNEKKHFKLHKIVNRLNKILSKGVLGENYLTFIICLIDIENKEIRFLNAGHPSMIEYDLSTHRSKIITENSTIPVGWLADFEYSEIDESVVSLKDDKAYLIYTDGLFECEDLAGEQLGLNRLAEFVDGSSGDCLCYKLPHIIRQKLIDNHYNIDLDDFTIVSFSTSSINEKDKDKEIFVIKTTYESSRDLALQCGSKVYKLTGNAILADKTEIVVNVFLNNIIQTTQNKKLFDLIVIELIVKEDVCLKLINRGEKLEFPVNSNIKSFDLLHDTKNLGLYIIQNLTKEITFSNYSEIFETILKIDDK